MYHSEVIWLGYDLIVFLQKASAHRRDILDGGIVKSISFKIWVGAKWNLHWIGIMVEK